MKADLKQNSFFSKIVFRKLFSARPTFKFPKLVAVVAGVYVAVVVAFIDVVAGVYVAVVADSIDVVVVMYFVVVIDDVCLGRP